MAFDRDVDYENPAQFAYLDIVSGSVVWFFEEDEDVEMYGLDTEENAAQRNRIGCDPGRFLLIPGLSHGEHHDILKSFLASRWTDDDRRRTFAQNAYTGSIGRWKMKSLIKIPFRRIKRNRHNSPPPVANRHAIIRR